MSDQDFLFDYDLPRELVAQEPLRYRADARMMVVDRQRQSVEHHHIRDLPYLLPAGDRLVMNDTKVIPARLVGSRIPNGGRWEGLFLEATAEGHWKILCKARGRLKPGDSVMLQDAEGRTGVKLWLVESLPEGQWLVHLESDERAEELLERLGRVPLPPYVRNGQMVDADVVNYQTVFARVPGAVAAPTAGLHFTKELLRSLTERGVECSAVTLHVGLGTFRPISAPSLDEHKMHRETGELSVTAAAEINSTRRDGGRIIAVGTTVMRVLETAARSQGENASEMVNGRPTIPPWRGETDLFIKPPFEFRAVDALLTNFHFPRTTLLVLVATFGGRELVEHAYREAIGEEYRFFIYGDSMLIV